MDTKLTIKDYYNAGVEGEWKRIENRPEFVLTCRFIDRYIKPGDHVLDIGGGPGRYSLYLLKKGCDVTLFDLSDKNTEFAKMKAVEEGFTLKTVCGDACEADKLIDGKFDHVLLMGPMYHLLNESDRIKAMSASISLLKDSGVLFVSFINTFAGMIYAMKFDPAIITDPAEIEFNTTIINNKDFAGKAFTFAYFAKYDAILPFMERFPLEKLHFFGQESIMSPCENNILSQPPEVVAAWYDLCEKLAEREDLLNWSEHLMYIGRKKK